MKLNTSTSSAPFIPQRPLSQNSSFVQGRMQTPPRVARFADTSPHASFEFEDLNSLSLEEINRELDQNINEVIMLLNRRKSLILNKKRRLKEEFSNKIAELKRYQYEDYVQDLQRVEDPLIQSLMQQKSLPKMQKLLGNVMRDQQDRKVMELSKSQEFWQYNKNVETEIDNLLKKLKYFDNELEKDNNEIYEICRQLDTIDDNIRDLLITKVDDNVQRAEPLFANKQRQQSILNGKLNQRNKLKDEKMNLIYKIIEELQRLRGLRQERINKLNIVFGDEENIQNQNYQGLQNVQGSQQNLDQPQPSKLQAYMDFMEQFDNIAQMRDQISKLEQAEQALLNDLDKLYRESDQVFSELIRRISEEAKTFNEWTENLKRRIRYIKANEYFFSQTNLPEQQNGLVNSLQLDLKEVSRKFKENMNYLKPLIEEDATIRAGLEKTGSTIQQFKNMILAIQNEKERRRELLQILENCARLRQEEDMKTEQLRNIELEINKKLQQKRNLEEDLDGVLGDADLNTFKKIESLLHDYDQELVHLNNQKRKIMKEIEEINQSVINLLARIKSDYDDILREILPKDWTNTYDLKKITDLKRMKNYLKKTFKRFGIMSD
ncbi:unnamed protein product (macronuclear) [Paramecium tetraurelia]|uniref:Uncharacterized protein n=1 Tax=Paramecium tetraurelia TaxID=5888 RepID=A0BQF3_PARTE|nr:uncharacterized protein GSPATT00030999001 [Paramecium tetraurelia]CAK60770.1 unnamed protein product [Paramecium tetraurelia]|eukprot:XP_001428168.1 hypothetical protein (macronuclear) [Paramecium tetraurelia strain d4-2]